MKVKKMKVPARDGISRSLCDEKNAAASQPMIRVAISKTSSKLIGQWGTSNGKCLRRKSFHLGFGT